MPSSLWLLPLAGGLGYPLQLLERTSSEIGSRFTSVGSLSSETMLFGVPLGSGLLTLELQGGGLERGGLERGGLEKGGLESLARLLSLEALEGEGVTERLLSFERTIRDDGAGLTWYMSEGL